jgi:uncharacterized protein DUF5335
MHNRQIPRAEWFRFFREFSARHEDWLVTVRITSPRIGSQVEARELPLEGIVASADATGPISIHVGRVPAKHIEHEVSDPVQVWVELSEEGAEQAVEIESKDGTKTIVEFRVAPPLETVDGLLHP